MEQDGTGWNRLEQDGTGTSLKEWVPATLDALDHEFGHSNWQFLRPNLKARPFAKAAVVERGVLQPAPVHSQWA